MALRMVDFKCLKCGLVSEDLVAFDERDHPRECPECGGMAVRVPCSPAIKYVKPHFNVSLGKHIKDAGHRDRLLKQSNSWMPSGNNDKARLFEIGSLEEQMNRDVEKRTKDRIRAIAEKTESELNCGGYLKRGELPARLQDKVEKANRKLKQA